MCYIMLHVTLVPVTLNFQRFVYLIFGQDQEGTILRYYYWVVKLNVTVRKPFILIVPSANNSGSPQLCIMMGSFCSCAYDTYVLCR